MAASGEFDYDREGYVHEVQHSIDFIGQDHQFFTEAKAEVVREIAQRFLGSPENLSVLDVGCGVGLLDEEIASSFGHVVGADASIGELQAANERNREASYAAADGGRLPFKDASFDIALAVCVVHHIPPADWDSFAQEVSRVVKPGGLAIVIEHNPFNPLTRLAVSRCSFDEDVVLLRRRRVGDLLTRSGMRVNHARYILFFPWRAPVWRRIEARLKQLPLGAQHLTVGVKH